MLTVTDLSVAYGPIKAVTGISFEIPRGAIVTLVGGNGAGKTTTLQTISGLDPSPSLSPPMPPSLPHPLNSTKHQTPPAAADLSNPQR